MRKFLERNQNRWESIVLAHILPFVAGSVNASGFFIVGAYTSHVTGSVARIGDDLAQGDMAGALQAVFFVVCFFVGAAAATVLMARSRTSGRGRYASPLSAEVTTLVAVTILGIAEPKASPLLGASTAALLCFAMGVQNALVTRLSGAVVRTTHLTGIVTDMGIESVHAYQWLKQHGNAMTLKALLATAVQFITAREIAKLRLHFAILFAFLMGALVGPYLYLRYGYASMLFPIGVLLTLIAFDIVIGLQGRDQSQSPVQPEGPKAFVAEPSQDAKAVAH